MCYEGRSNRMVARKTRSEEGFLRKEEKSEVCSYSEKRSQWKKKVEGPMSIKKGMIDGTRF